MFELAAGVHVFLRGRDALQFGLDATRAGIIETPHAPMLLATLLSARGPRERSELVDGLVAAGLGPAAAHSLIDDLVAYRILVPCEEREVILLGRGRLAQSITELLSLKGIRVRSPIRGESEFAYLAAARVDAPVVLVDRLAHSRATAPMLTRFARTWTSCAVVDHRGVIGPLRIDAEGPCPLCADLHRTDADGFWHRGAGIGGHRGTRRVPSPAGVLAHGAPTRRGHLRGPLVGAAPGGHVGAPAVPGVLQLQRKADRTASNCAP